MSHIAQRRDLSDPSVIVEFARTGGRPQPLRTLYLLTVADIRASSKTAWTEWKGSCSTSCSSGPASSSRRATTTRSARRADRAARRDAARGRGRGAARRGRRRGARSSEYFDMMPQRYFISHTPTQIARHARVVIELPAPTSSSRTAVREMRGDFTEFILYTRDVHGLYSNVAGVLTAHDINILGAHVYTTRDGLALEVYRVTTPPGDEDRARAGWEEFLASLERVLRGESQRGGAAARGAAARRRSRAPSPRQPEAVEISNEESDFYTIVDVLGERPARPAARPHAHDRGARLEIYISKAGKVLDQVADTFYLKDARGRKISRTRARSRRCAAICSRRSARGERACRGRRAEIARGDRRLPAPRGGRARALAAHARGLRPRPRALRGASRTRRGVRRLADVAPEHVAAFSRGARAARARGAQPRARARRDAAPRCASRARRTRSAPIRCAGVASPRVDRRLPRVLRPRRDRPR